VSAGTKILLKAQDPLSNSMTVVILGSLDNQT